MAKPKWEFLKRAAMDPSIQNNQYFCLFFAFVQRMAEHQSSRLLRGEVISQQLAVFEMPS